MKIVFDKHSIYKYVIRSTALHLEFLFLYLRTIYMFGNMKGMSTTGRMSLGGMKYRPNGR